MTETSRMKAKATFLSALILTDFQGQNKKFQRHCCLDLCWVMGQNEISGMVLSVIF